MISGGHVLHEALRLRLIAEPLIARIQARQYHIQLSYPRDPP
jgi:hypothetical protein